MVRVHALDLSVRPGMVVLGKPVIDTIDAAHSIEGMPPQAGGGALTVPRQVGELDAVVGEHGMDAVPSGHRRR
jgi:hypothetical protein